MRSPFATARMLILRVLKALYHRSPPRVRVAAQKALWCTNVLPTLEFSSVRQLRESMQTVWLSLRVRNYTMEHPPRLKTLCRLCNEIDALNIPGDIVECGVWNGGSAAVMAYSTRHSRLGRAIWLFDPFEGMPAPTFVDGDRAASMFHRDWIVGHVPRVQEVFRKLRISDRRVRIVKGWFEETFPSVDIPRIALLHIDADWYQSVKICLERSYDAVQPGGIVVLDDYSYWEGCRKATHEFIATRKPVVEPQLDGSMLLRKPPDPSKGVLDGTQQDRWPDPIRIAAALRKS